MMIGAGETGSDVSPGTGRSADEDEPAGGDDLDGVWRRSFDAGSGFEAGSAGGVSAAGSGASSMPLTADRIGDWFPFLMLTNSTTAIPMNVARITMMRMFRPRVSIKALWSLLIVSVGAHFRELSNYDLAATKLFTTRVCAQTSSLLC
jgi:hypothetical protein